MKHFYIRCALGILALAAAPSAVFAQPNVVGTWQGTLKPPNAPPDRPGLRIVLKISRNADESLKGVLYSIDQNPTPINASAISQNGSTLKMSIAAIGGEFEGKLSSDGSTIAGQFSQGGPNQPLEFAKATTQTAWVIPEPPPPTKPMDPEAKPVFEVATIKPSDPNRPGQSILVGRGGANLLTTTNTSLHDLIIFAYGIHPKQLIGLPGWAESDKYDLTAKPDKEGVPNPTQLRVALQKLLEERFQLTFHREKRELSAYILAAGKTPHKMNPTQRQGNLPGFGGRGPGSILVSNATMPEFTDFLQARLLDRPVVDQTGITGRWDFTLKWVPDAAALAQLPPGVTPPPPADDAAPDIFGAVQSQLGLKLEGTKAPVEVLVVDKVSKPSEN
jgi:uncharacterized protein (TIGR03435 family)